MRSPHNLLKTLEWMRSQRDVRVQPMDPAESAEWHYGSERISHRTKRFYSITGLEYRRNGRLQRQPIIDQQEVGTLAFLFRQREKLEVLVQIKAEPGNVNDFQLAPTCQATQSNLDRIHGGCWPPGCELAQGPGTWRTIADSLQSEQGTRFFHKRNRNRALLWTDEQRYTLPSPLYARWSDLRALLSLLKRDYIVNTDARSALVTTPWDFLGQGEPFARAHDVFGRLLYNSWRSETREAAAEAAESVLEWLQALRHSIPEAPARTISLDAIEGFRKNGSGISGKGSHFEICHYRVRIPGREREEWDQPLIKSACSGFARLAACWHDDQLRFVFRAVREPGLANLVELNPVDVRAPGEPKSEDIEFAANGEGCIVVNVQQSEEGGRFYRDSNLYQIVLLRRDWKDLPANHVALSLRQIDFLMPHGVFTNEARSTVSLLLAYC